MSNLIVLTGKLKATQSMLTHEENEKAEKVLSISASLPGCFLTQQSMAMLMNGFMKSKILSVTVFNTCILTFSKDIECHTCMFIHFFCFCPLPIELNFNTYNCQK